jgi:tripartite-type tricarboxylate transporter receptor subunit TctC
METHSHRTKPSAQASAMIFAALAFATMAATPVRADIFPSRPVKIIVQTAAGSSIDVAARVLAESLSRKWGQQAYVANQPGAGGAVAARALAQAPPDGGTLLFAASSVFVALPELQEDQAESIAAFVPVAFVGEQPMAVTVGAQERAKTLAELIDRIRGTAGGVNCAVSTRGGLSHLTAEALKGATKTEMTFVHYPGTAQALTDVMSGRVPMVIDSVSAFIGPAGGQIRILALGSAKRLNKMPDIPTIGETVPGFEASGWFALVAPPATPAAIAARIGRDVDDILADADVVKRMEEVGTYVRRMSTAELADFIKAQRAKWAPVVQQFGVAQ